MNKSILVLPGDGIGQEVTESALTILYELDRRYNLNLDVSIMDLSLIHI